MELLSLFSVSDAEYIWMQMRCFRELRKIKKKKTADDCSLMFEDLLKGEQFKTIKSDYKGSSFIGPGIFVQATETQEEAA